jgi:hypothetical protein
MSRQFTNSYNRKPFCKVCADAGKSDTAHFPRKTPDLNSQVICPTLLTLECRYCFKNGHTVKYCSVLKQRNLQDIKDRNRQDRDKEDKHKDRLVIPHKPINKFSALLEEEELAEQEEHAIVIATNGIAVKRDMDFPESLSKKTNVINNNNNNNNWAIMAANASAIAIPKFTIVKPVIHTNNNNNNNNTQWADDSDDEQQPDEDEDEEETQIQIPTYTQSTFVDYNVYEDEW